MYRDISQWNEAQWYLFHLRVYGNIFTLITTYNNATNAATLVPRHTPWNGPPRRCCQESSQCATGSSAPKWLVLPSVLVRLAAGWYYDSKQTPSQSIIRHLQFWAFVYLVKECASKRYLQKKLTNGNATCSSAVECRIRNRESPGSNPLCYHFEVWAFSFSPQRPSSLSCINEYLTLDGGGNVSKYAFCIIAVWLECFQ